MFDRFRGRRRNPSANEEPNGPLSKPTAVRTFAIGKAREDGLDRYTVCLVTAKGDQVFQLTVDQMRSFLRLANFLEADPDEGQASLPPAGTPEGS